MVSVQEWCVIVLYFTGDVIATVHELQALDVSNQVCPVRDP